MTRNSAASLPVIAAAGLAALVAGDPANAGVVVPGPVLGTGAPAPALFAAGY